MPCLIRIPLKSIEGRTEIEIKIIKRIFHMEVKGSIAWRIRLYLGFVDI